MEMVILKRDSSDWNYAWDWLKAHPINEGLEEPHVGFNNGEVWQYLLTYRNGDKLITEFRHRCHPVTQDVYRVSVEHTLSGEGNIEVSKKIK